MKTNIRIIPADRVSQWLAHHPDADPVEWDEDGGHFEGVRLHDGSFFVSTQYAPTAAQIAQAAAEKAAASDRAAKAATIIDAEKAAIADDKALIAQVNAGALTNAQRDAAIKKLAQCQKALARAVVFLAKGELGNE